MRVNAPHGAMAAETDSPMVEHLYKVLVIGDFGVGEYQACATINEQAITIVLYCSLICDAPVDDTYP